MTIFQQKKMYKLHTNKYTHYNVPINILLLLFTIVQYYLHSFHIIKINLYRKNIVFLTHFIFQIIKFIKYGFDFNYII